MSKEHRITRCGNSSAITLANDELAHLRRAQGDSVIIQKTRQNRLIILPAAKRSVRK